MRKAVVLGVVALLSGGANWAAAQNTAEGRAFGTTIDLLGQNLIDQSDTQTQNAPKASNTPNPSTINKTAAGATIPLAPVAEVITGPSTVRGCSTPGGCPTLFTTPGPTPLAATLSNEVFVQSDAGDATASVLIDAGPNSTNVLDAVSSGSTVTVRCNNDDPGTAVPQFTATSHVDALVIAGNVVPVPGEVAPNTSILAAQFPLLTLNEQDCHLTPNNTDPTGVTCTVNALHAQILPVTGLGLVDVKLSGASGSITFDETCVCDGAILKLKKTPQVLTPGGTVENPPNPNPGDRIRYTLALENSGCVAADDLSIIDRLPNGATVVQASLPANSSIAACTQTITGCPANASSNQCLTIPVGTVDAGQTREFTFEVTINSNAGCNQSGVGFPVCNVARAQNPDGSTTSPSAPGIVLCPNGQPTPVGTNTPGGGNGTPIPTRTGTPGTPVPVGTSTPGINTGDILVTSGSGGCALNPHSSALGSESLPMMLLGLVLVIRRTRRRRG